MVREHGCAPPLSRHAGLRLHGIRACRPAAELRLPGSVRSDPWCAAPPGSAHDQPAGPTGELLPDPPRSGGDRQPPHPRRLRPRRLRGPRCRRDRGFARHRAVQHVLERTGDRGAHPGGLGSRLSRRSSGERRRAPCTPARLGDRHLRRQGHPGTGGRGRPRSRGHDLQAGRWVAARLPPQVDDVVQRVEGGQHRKPLGRVVQTALHARRGWPVGGHSREASRLGSPLADGPGSCSPRRRAAHGDAALRARECSGPRTRSGAADGRREDRAAPPPGSSRRADGSSEPSADHGSRAADVRPLAARAHTRGCSVRRHRQLQGRERHVRPPRRRSAASVRRRSDPGSAPRQRHRRPLRRRRVRRACGRCLACGRP